MTQLSRRQGQFARRGLVAVSLFILVATIGCQVVSPNAGPVGASASMSNNDIWNALTGNPAVSAMAYTPTPVAQPATQLVNVGASATSAAAASGATASPSSHFGQQPVVANTQPKYEPNIQTQSPTVAMRPRVVAPRPTATAAAKAKSQNLVRKSTVRTASPISQIQRQPQAQPRRMPATRPGTRPGTRSYVASNKGAALASTSARPKFGGHFAPDQVAAANAMLRRPPRSKVPAAPIKKARPAKLASKNSPAKPTLVRPSEEKHTSVATKTTVAQSRSTPAVMASVVTKKSLQTRAKKTVVTAPKTNYAKTTYPTTKFSTTYTLRNQTDASQLGGIALSEMPSPPAVHRSVRLPNVDGAATEDSTTAVAQTQRQLLRMPVDAKLEAPSRQPNKSVTPIVSRIPFLAKNTPSTEAEIKIDIDEAPTVEGDSNSPSNKRELLAKRNPRSDSAQKNSRITKSRRDLQVAQRSASPRSASPRSAKSTSMRLKKKLATRTSIAKRTQESSPSIVHLPKMDMPKVDENRPPVVAKQPPSAKSYAEATPSTELDAPKSKTPRAKSTAANQGAKRSDGSAERFPMRGPFMASSTVADKRNRRNVSPMLRRHMEATSLSKKTQRKHQPSVEEAIASSDESLLELPKRPAFAKSSQNTKGRVSEDGKSATAQKFALQQPINKWRLPDVTTETSSQQVERISRLPAGVSTSRPKPASNVTPPTNSSARNSAPLQISPRALQLAPLAKFSGTVKTKYPSTRDSNYAQPPASESHQPLASIEPPEANAQPTLRTGAVVKLAPTPARPRTVFGRRDVPMGRHEIETIRIGRTPTRINLMR